MAQSAQLLIWLEDGLAQAKTAVELDKNQKECVREYQTCIDILSKVLDSGKEHDVAYGGTNEADIENLIVQYQKRATHLAAEMSKRNTASRAPGRGKKSRRKYSMSRMPFQEMKFKETQKKFNPTDKPPSDPVRKPFWLMRTLANTADGKGDYVNASIFVPNLVWMQDSAKFTGHTVKMDCFQQLMIHVKVLESCPSPTTAKLGSELISTISRFLHQTAQIHRTLAKTFNFLPEPEEDELAHQVEGASKNLLSNILTSIANVGEKLEKIISIPVRIPSTELQKYAATMNSLFNTCQFIDTWIHFSQNPSEAKEGEKHEMIGAFIANHDHHAKLKQISTFMMHVVVKIVIRDFRRLTERYLRKTRKTFTRMYIEGESYQ